MILDPITRFDDRECQNVEPDYTAEDNEIWFQDLLTRYEQGWQNLKEGVHYDHIQL
jgi:hypothetical protein